MAFSKEEAQKRWIKKLKYRMHIFEKIGQMTDAESLKKVIAREIKEHGI